MFPARISGTRLSRCARSSSGQLSNYLRSPAQGWAVTKRAGQPPGSGGVGPGLSGSGVNGTLSGTAHFSKGPESKFLRVPKMPAPARPGTAWGIMQSAPGFYSGHLGHMYPIFRKVLREICTEKRLRKMPFMCPKCPEMIVPGNPGSCTHILGKSYEKIVQEKDPGNNPQVARVARNHTAHSSKRFVTCPVRCPFVFRPIVKRHAMTGLRLGRYKESGQPPGSGGVGAGPENNEQPLGETLK